MSVITDELRRNLHAIRHALVGLRFSDIANDDSQLDEIRRLEASCRAIQAVIEARRTLRGHKVINLLAWREGSLVAASLAPRRRAATLTEYLQNQAQESH